jgi:hypothetical protein
MLSTTLNIKIKAATRRFLDREAHRLATEFFGKGRYEIEGAYADADEAPDSLGQYVFHVYVKSK